ncbi:MAG: aspartate aminotransferase family protein [Candidatus Dormibacteria bacterium]
MSTAAPVSAAVWRDRDAELISPAYGRYSNLVVDSAEGTLLHTVDGRSVLDFGCGIGVTNLGHRHPVVTAAVHRQVDRYWHTSVTTLHTAMIDAASALLTVMPETLDQVFFTNSGAEAIESALKLARRSTGRSDIIAFRGGFHGRTYGALSLTASKARYRNRMGPFLPGVHHVRYPYCFRYCSHRPDEPCDIAAGKDIDELFATTVPPDSVAAIVVEPVLGEGGYVVPPRTFLPSLRALCDEHGILLIVDEVQTGFGRTGRFWGFEHTRTLPDIVCMAKGLGNGMPISAVVASHRLMSAWNPGEHGGTYAGNAVACAAAEAVVNTLVKEHLAERAATLGARILERARGWQASMPELADVRGLGLMIGLEFMQDGRPAHHLVAHIQRHALSNDLLFLTCGIDDNVIRLLPPLTVSEDELERGLTILENAMHSEERR